MLGSGGRAAAPSGGTGGGSDAAPGGCGGGVAEAPGSASGVEPGSGGGGGGAGFGSPGTDGSFGCMAAAFLASFAPRGNSQVFQKFERRNRPAAHEAGTCRRVSQHSSSLAFTTPTRWPPTSTRRSNPPSLCAGLNSSKPSRSRRLRILPVPANAGAARAHAAWIEFPPPPSTRHSPDATVFDRPPAIAEMPPHTALARGLSSHRPTLIHGHTYPA